MLAGYAIFGFMLNVKQDSKLRLWVRRVWLRHGSAVKDIVSGTLGFAAFIALWIATP